MFGFTLQSPSSSQQPFTQVTEVHHDSPAQRSGLKVTDLLLEVNGHLVKGLSLASVERRMFSSCDNLSLVVISPRGLTFFQHQLSKHLDHKLVDQKHLDHKHLDQKHTDSQPHQHMDLKIQDHKHKDHKHKDRHHRIHQESQHNQHKDYKNQDSQHQIHQESQLHYHHSQMFVLPKHSFDLHLSQGVVRVYRVDERAGKKGLQPGDEVTAVSGVEVKGQSLLEVYQRLRDCAGSVRLMVRRGIGKPEMTSQYSNESDVTSQYSNEPDVTSQYCKKPDMTRQYSNYSSDSGYSCQNDVNCNSNRLHRSMSHQVEQSSVTSPQLIIPRPKLTHLACGSTATADIDQSERLLSSDVIRQLSQTEGDNNGCEKAAFRNVEEGNVHELSTKNRGFVGSLQSEQDIRLKLSHFQIGDVIGPPLADVTSGETSEHQLVTEAHLQRVVREVRGYFQEMKLCCVCLERDKCVTFVPCGHLVCCHLCADLVTSCPMCRAKVESRVKTFFS